MSFEPAQGRWVTQKIPKKASTTYTAGMMLYNDKTDNVPATTTTQTDLRGICLEAYASTDTTTAQISVRVPSGLDCTFYGDMATGETISATSVGDSFDFASGGLTVSTTSTYDPVTLIKYINSLKGEFAYNPTTGIEN